MVRDIARFWWWAVEIWMVEMECMCVCVCVLCREREIILLCCQKAWRGGRRERELKGRKKKEKEHESSSLYNNIIPLPPSPSSGQKPK